MKLREWYYDKRFHLFKQITIDGIVFSFYWKLCKSKIKRDRAYVSIRKYSPYMDYLKNNIREEYRQCLANRILQGKKHKLWTKSE